MAQQWILSVALEDNEKNRKLIQEAIKHDWLLYQNQGMKSPTVSGWLTFIINKRLTEIRDGRI